MVPVYSGYRSIEPVLQRREQDARYCPGRAGAPRRPRPARDDLAQDVGLGEALGADLEGLGLRADDANAEQQKQRTSFMPRVRAACAPASRNCSAREVRVQAALRASAPRACPARRSRPRSITTMRSACCTVARRCAMTSVVRPRSSALQRLLHQALALGVERAGRLVEQQDRPVGEQRARDRQALALAAGELHAALAELACRGPAAGAR